MPKNVVELKDVSIYQRKNLILHDINLTIERGEFEKFPTEDSLWRLTP